jgi:hypothetical protein
MINKQDLLDKGYKEFTCHGIENKTCDNVLYGKTFFSNDIKLYFIHFKIWYFSKYYSVSNIQDCVSSETYFYIPITFKADEFYTVHFKPLIEHNITVQEVEKLFQSAYEKLGCVPDIHNNN